MTTMMMRQQQQQQQVVVVVEGDNINMKNDNGKSSSRRQRRLWMLPWIIFMGVLYWFIVVWINMAIIQKYFINHNWDAALPGLDTTLMRKYTMTIHFTSGSISLVLGPFQFISSWIRTYISPIIHRWIGRIYCICAIISSIFGLLFIILKEGKLVGGYNMAIAFTFSGSIFGIFGFKVWKTARNAKTTTMTTTTTTTAISTTTTTTGTSQPPQHKRSFLLNIHRNWGIRSYSQILAPMLYRYWHFTLEVFGIYHIPNTHGDDDACNTEDLCKDFFRLFDKIHVWTYWLSSWLVAEIIIYYLNKHDDDDDDDDSADNSSRSTESERSPPAYTTTTQRDDEDPERTPLLTNDKMQQHPSSEQESSSSTDPNNTIIATNDTTTTTTNTKCRTTPAMSLNMIGSILAIIFSVITIKMFT